MSYYRLPSYDNTYAECYSSFDTRDEPCWGQVNCIDEYKDDEDNWYCIYSCEGHQYTGYEPSKHPQDQVEPKEYDY